MPGAIFLFRNGPHTGKRLKLPNKPFVIGRSDACDLRIRSEQVSRSHCEVRQGPSETFVICDLGSRNGTFVNGQRIDTAVTLSDGDQIRVAKVELEFVVAPLADCCSKEVDTITSETTTKNVDPTRLTLDELVKFDDDSLELESDRPTAESDALFEANSEGLKSPTPAQKPSHSKEVEATRSAAKEALKQLFRGRNFGRQD